MKYLVFGVLRAVRILSSVYRVICGNSKCLAGKYFTPSNITPNYSDKTLFYVCPLGRRKCDTLGA